MWSFLKLRLEFFLQCSPTGNSVIRGIFETLIFCFLWPTKPLIRVSELSLATEKVWERKESYFYFYFWPNFEFFLFFDYLVFWLFKWRKVHFSLAGRVFFVRVFSSEQWGEWDFQNSNFLSLLGQPTYKECLCLCFLVKNGLVIELGTGVDWIGICNWEENVSYIYECTYVSCVCVLDFRWLNEAHGTSLGENEGILYTASSSTCVGSMEIMSSDFDSQIVLNLRREEDNGKNEAAEEGVSGQEYALLSESMWLRALKWWVKSWMKLIEFCSKTFAKYLANLWWLEIHKSYDLSKSHHSCMKCSSYFDLSVHWIWFCCNLYFLNVESVIIWTSNSLS